MPGPGNKKKQQNNKDKNKANDQTGVGQPQVARRLAQPASQTPLSQCQTLEEDEMTRCDQPATQGYPKKERCKKHQKQYILMCKKYKNAAHDVDGLRNDLPDEEQINQYKDVSSSLKKARMIRKYVEAIRVERTGRQIHQTRFFLKVDDGHKMRVKVLAKEIDKGIKALNALHTRAYELYAVENSLPDWAKQPGSDPANAPLTGEPNLGAENSKEFSKLASAGAGEGVRQPQAHNIDEDEDEDVIDLKLRKEKAEILSCLQPFLDRETMISKQFELQGLTDPEKRRGLEFDKMKYQMKMFHIIMQQYIRRIIFHDPVLFMKALDKVSFEDLLLSKDFSIEDMLRIWQLLNKRLHIGLRWYKDAVVEAIAIRDAGTAANVGAPADRFQIVGGWIFNRTHLRKTSNEAWYWLLTTLETPANIENRFVRLCNTYDDLLDFVSHGALGLYPQPSFCQSKHGSAAVYRTHLSLAGVVICDMVSAWKSPQLCGPFPSTHRPRQPGCIVWAELQSRSYLFGALRNEPDTFQEAFLNELRARPDLFQVVTRCDSDPARVVKSFGNGEAEALPHIRSQTFEAPAASLENRPQGPGQWQVFRSAVDVLYGTQDAIGGYLVTPKKWAECKTGNNYFFYFKTFPVTYILILDTTPNRHYDVLAKQVAWAAFRAKGIVKGAYEFRKYAIASDKLFEDCAKKRLSWMPECMGTWHTTKLADSM